jgi:alginate O-acetyltransferase complex protein AlgI
MITFLICGIWHGTTWNFVIWGGMQGLFLGLEQLFLGKWLKKIKVFSVIYTLFVVMIGFIFIMTPNLKVAAHYIKAMFFSGKIAPLGRNAFLTNEYITLFIIGALLSIPIILPERFKTGSMGSIISVTKTVFLIAIFLLSIMTVVTETYNPFIYFRF